MNYRMISNTVGRIMTLEAVLLVFPAIGAIIYKESGTLPAFAATIATISIVSVIAMKIKPKKQNIYAKEGYFIVAMSWILMSLFGAMPFYLSGYIPNPADAFFETVSGLTTTGASILTNVDALPKSLLFWRSFTHWIGGMGILVFAIAFMPKTEQTSMHIMRAEMPGPTVDKLVSKITVSARILYGIYCALTVAEMILLYISGMPLFDSIVNSFATAGTGGFAITNAGIPGYNNVAAEMILAVFMLIFGVNFNLYYLILMKQGKQALKSEELRWYIAIIAASTVVLAIPLMATKYSVGESFRYSFFQVASILTTTGFATADFNTWSVFSKVVIVLLMFSGGCAGSTSGGMKLSRIMILVKSSIRDIKKAVYPRSVEKVKIDNRSVDESIVHGVTVFFTTYMLVLALGCVIVSFDGRDVVTTVTAVISCISNIGPGLGAVGPMGSFAGFSVLSKITLSIIMLAGRLELIPMLMLFSPYAWSKKYL